MAIGAGENTFAPQLAQTRHVGKVVRNAGGQHQASGSQFFTVIRGNLESFFDTFYLAHTSVQDMDTLGLELFASDSEQLVGWGTVTTPKGVRGQGLDRSLPPRSRPCYSLGAAVSSGGEKLELRELNVCVSVSEP